MTAGRNWTRQRDRNRIARQGAETLDGLGVAVGAPAARKSPRELRVELAAAPMARGAMITKVIQCRCGHSGTVRISAASAIGRKFKCSKCKRVAG